MYDKIKTLMLNFLKVPPEPTDPMGDADSLVVFRASRNYYKYRVFMWAGGVIASWGGALTYLGISYFTTELDFRGDDEFLRVLFIIGELLALVGLLLGTIWSYMLLRLDYELRWYKVTDRSLRIREGVMAVREMTMTFDNIQNISVTQGPVQRFLKIADLRVETAGGGGELQSGSKNHELGLNMHVGYFRGIDNADDVLTLMQQRLRKARGSGLGDIDDEQGTTASPSSPSSPSSAETTAAGDGPNGELLDAARELLAEVKQLRAAAER